MSSWSMEDLCLISGMQILGLCDDGLNWIRVTSVAHTVGDTCYCVECHPSLLSRNGLKWLFWSSDSCSYLNVKVKLRMCLLNIPQYIHSVDIQTDSAHSIGIISVDFPRSLEYYWRELKDSFAVSAIYWNTDVVSFQSLMRVHKM